MHSVDEVYILFKTHLDVGFTDFAANVVDTYMTGFIPQVLNMEDNRFKWTTGSWLIREYLKRADGKGRKKMESAILAGRIAWHGLPFTTHTEAMNPHLFQYGLSLSQELDRSFGKTTVAAKMTDVPGHTKAMITPLAEAGVTFLHLGKNPFCTAPDVPPLFRWVDSGGQEVTVMYEMEYGACGELPGTGKAVYFAHSYDNAGPPSPGYLNKLYDDLHIRFPGAKLTPADLNDVAKAAETVRETLPKVYAELGDTWIHGIGSDPRKLSGYRALSRYSQTLSKTESDKMNSFLILVPEHTWGLDEKKYLHDFFGYVRTEFEKKRRTQPYRLMEKSWREQRNYVNAAAECLPEQQRIAAAEILREYKRPKTREAGCAKAGAGEHIRIGNAEVAFHSTGAIEYLSVNGRVLADADHLWFAPVYEAFCKADYDRFLTQYVTERPMPWWAVEDLSKTGVDMAINEHLIAKPLLRDVLVKGNKVTARMSFPGDANALYGAPGEMEATLTFSDGRPPEIDFAWWGKPATRVAEAIWLAVCPKESPLYLQKMGQWIDPLTVIKNGNRHLSGVDFGVKAGDIAIRTLDAGLVAPGKPSLLDFNNAQPDLSRGFSFNLYNNIWGTNFPMWYDEDARFRFNIELSEA